MSLSRKLKDFDGVKPPQSFLIHPVTLRLIEDKKEIERVTSTLDEIFQLPTINFTKEDILKAYNIKFINDLENYLENNTENIRIIRIFFEENKNKIKRIEKNDILNVLEILGKKYNFTFDKSLKLLQEYINSKKDWEDVFKK